MIPYICASYVRVITPIITKTCANINVYTRHQAQAKFKQIDKCILIILLTIVSALFTCWVMQLQVHIQTEFGWTVVGDKMCALPQQYHSSNPHAGRQQPTAKHFDKFDCSAHSHRDAVGHPLLQSIRNAYARALFDNADWDGCPADAEIALQVRGGKTNTHASALAATFHPNMNF